MVAVAIACQSSSGTATNHGPPVPLTTPANKPDEPLGLLATLPESAIEWATEIAERGRIVVDSEGNVYVAETVLTKYGPDGTIIDGVYADGTAKKLITTEFKATPSPSHPTLFCGA